MKKAVVILIIVLGCGKDEIKTIPDYGPFQGIVSFYDANTGSKVIPSEVFIGNMKLANSSAYTPTFNQWEELDINDTGAVSFKQDPGSATILARSAAYLEIPYTISGLKYAGENSGAIPASLVSTEKYLTTYRIGLYRKAVTTIHVKQVTEYAPSTFRIWLDSYKSIDITEANKIVRVALLPEGIYQSPDKKIDTTIEVILPGDMYSSLHWELFSLPDGWGDFYYQQLGNLDAKKYAADMKHSIEIIF
jgi:hypothetical protein